MSEKIKITKEDLKKNPTLIQHIDNPSDKLCIFVLNESALAYRFIKNPSETVSMYAVALRPFLIQEIDNPSERTCLAALNHSSSWFKFMENPSENVSISAVSKDGYLLEHVKNQTEKICLAAVNNQGLSLYFAQYKTNEICLAAVKNNGRALEYVDEHLRTKEICEAAIDEDSLAFSYIPHKYRDDNLLLKVFKRSSNLAYSMNVMNISLIKQFIELSMTHYQDKKLCAHWKEQLKKSLLIQKISKL